MEIPKTLRRPKNWQDFETLCKKLWGEIWSCPEIKKNGREGQSQHGVDIYGIPFGENEYYGIQCKGKDEYTSKQLTKEEVTTEIEKAKLFKPPLKKLYFATTAIKDTVIEEFIREKNLENKSKGLFEVHIFSWDEIVELIDTNRQTNDYYLKSQNYKSIKNVSIVFQNGLTDITVNPKFKKTITNFRNKTALPNSFPGMQNLAYTIGINAILKQQEQFARLIPDIVYIERTRIKINQSLCQIFFKIHNTGLEPLEEYKMFFDFKNEIQEITDDNEVNKGIISMPSIRQLPNIILFRDTMEGKVIPQKTILVGDDTFISDKFFIKPFPKNYEIKVHWKLISKNFKDEGELKIIVDLDMEIDYKTILVEDSAKVGIKESMIEDVLVDKNKID